MLAITRSVAGSNHVYFSYRIYYLVTAAFARALSIAISRYAFSLRVFKLGFWCVCVCVHVHTHSIYVEVKGQLSGFSLSTVCVLGSKPSSSTVYLYPLNHFAQIKRG